MPLAPMTGSAEMRRAYDDVVLPALEEFEPELVLVSAGFDADARDPLAKLDWSEDDFAWVTRRAVRPGASGTRRAAWSRHSRGAMICRRWARASRPMWRF